MKKNMKKQGKCAFAEKCADKNCAAKRVKVTRVSKVMAVAIVRVPKSKDCAMKAKNAPVARPAKKAVKDTAKAAKRASKPRTALQKARRAYLDKCRRDCKTPMGVKAFASNFARKAARAAKKAK